MIIYIDWKKLKSEITENWEKKWILFHFREESPGAVFWHEKGWLLFQRLVEYMRAKQRLAGYKEINTPELLDKTLWEKSGHWDKFGEHMFTSETPDEKTFAVKPMNCPGCVQVFNQGLKSYRDLPLNYLSLAKFIDTNLLELYMDY